MSKKDPIREGIEKKGGVKPPPSKPRPDPPRPIKPPPRKSDSTQKPPLTTEPPQRRD